VEAVIGSVESMLNDECLDPATPVGLILFGRAVSIYRGESVAGRLF